MANQDFRRMTPGVTQDAMTKRIDRLERGGAGTPSVFRKPVTFAPEPGASPGVEIRSVTDPAIEPHNTFVIYAADGETILLRVDNSGNIETTGDISADGRVNANTPRFLVRASGAQVVGNESLTVVQFNNVQYDSHSVFSPFSAGTGGWFTVPVGWGGTWALSASVGAGSTANTGLLRAQIDTDPAGGTSFTTIRSEGTVYKHWNTAFPWVVGAPYTEVGLVEGERGVVEVQMRFEIGTSFVVDTNPTTFFFGKWIHD